MFIYILQEKVDDNTWFDLYTNDLCMLKEMILVLKNKNKDKKYRIIKVFQ